jgi:O-antigen/teichoic acid export membrane protein
MLLMSPNSDGPNSGISLHPEVPTPQTMRLGRVINNSVALILLDLLNKAIPLVVFPWVVRALGPAVYGQLGFATAVAGFFSLLASPGFTTYALREAAKDSTRVSFLVQHVLGARLIFATAAFVVLLVFAGFLAPREGEIRVLILLSGLAFLLTSIDTQWIFAARSRMWIIAGRGALSQFVYAALILSLVHRAQDAWIVPAAGLVSSGLTTFLLWSSARREYHIPLPKISPQTWRVFLGACLIMGLSSLMSMIYDQIDTVMLKYFRPDHELGLYVASYSLMTMALSFPPILGQVFLPLLSKSAGQDSNDERKYLLWLGHAIIGLALPIAAGGFILAVPLTNFVLGGQYLGSGILFRWLMLTVVTGSLASYFGSQLIPNHREQKYLISVLSGAATNVVLNLLLIPRYGAIAAAFTTAVSQGAVAILNYYFVRDLPRPSLWGATALSLAATGVMTASLFLVRTVFSVHVIESVFFGALVFGATYVLGLAMRKGLRNAGNA